MFVSYSDFQHDTHPVTTAHLSLPLFPFPTITATRSISPKHGDRGHLSPHVASHAAASAAQTRQSTVPTTTVKELAQAAKATMEVVQHQEMGTGVEREFAKDAKSGVLVQSLQPCCNKHQFTA